MVGKGLPLDQDRQKGTTASVDEAPLLEQPRIDVIEEDAGTSGHLNQTSLLGTEVGFASERSDQLASESEGLASASRSAVDLT